MQKNYHVRALKRKTSRIPFFISPDIFSKIEWVDGDITDIVSLDEAIDADDLVIHAAAMVSFQKKDRKKMMSVNVDGTANVVNIALEKNIRRLVHVSSIAALGRTKHSDLVTEEKKWQPGKNNTTYAISKYKAEMELWRAMGEGLNAAIVNPSTILGYGDWNETSCRIFKSVYDGFPWYTNGINGFVDVEDTAKAIVLLMESDIKEERFIVNGDNCSFRELFDMMADGFDKPRASREATPFLSALAWRLEKIKTSFSGTAPLLTKESARIAQSSTYFANEKILNALPGFSFTPLQESVERACKKYLEAINKVQP